MFRIVLRVDSVTISAEPPSSILFPREGRMTTQRKTWENDVHSSVGSPWRGARTSRLLLFQGRSSFSCSRYWCRWRHFHRNTQGPTSKFWVRMSTYRSLLFCVRRTTASLVVPCTCYYQNLVNGPGLRVYLGGGALRRRCSPPEANNQLPRPHLAQPRHTSGSPPCPNTRRPARASSAP